MLEDILTVARKELMEILRVPANMGFLSLIRTNRDGLLAFLLPVVGIGVVVPLIGGARVATSPITLGVVVIVVTLLILPVVTDAFAGERERRTLESLLTTRLPEKAILIGKIVTAAGWAWAQAIGTILACVITASVMSGKLVAFDLSDLVRFVVFGLFTVIVFVCAGVLISLSARTVVQATRNLFVSFVLPFYGAIVLPKLLSRVWPTGFARLNATVLAGDFRIDIAVALFMLLLVAGLYKRSLARFKRGSLLMFDA